MAITLIIYTFGRFTILVAREKQFFHTLVM